MTAAQAILDRGYGRPAQTIDASITENEPIKLFAEVPMKSKSLEAWPTDVGKSLITGVAVAAMREVQS